MRCLLGLVLLASVTVGAAAQTASPLASPPPAGFPAASVTPPAPLPVDAAVLKVADELFRQVADAGESIEIVIDPLIDGITGAQTAATRSIDRRIVEIAAERHPRIKILPFTRDAVARAKFVFIGTFNPINNAGQPAGVRDAFWICFALVDLKTKLVAARAVGRVSPDRVDATPAALFAASPVWALDKATLAYIRACQRSRPGDAVAPEYVDRLETKAALTEAHAAFDVGRFDDALTLFRRAEALPGGGEKIDALNGLYLTLMRAGQTSEAMAVFGRMIDIGLEQKRLGVILQFETGSAGFVRIASVSGVYPAWLERIAARTREAGVCLTVVGHASRTGPEPLNISLTRARAASVRDHLLRTAPQLTSRVSTFGAGSSEVLVGLPFDDAQTALDRRVEFRPRVCGRRAGRDRHTAMVPAPGGSHGSISGDRGSA